MELDGLLFSLIHQCHTHQHSAVSDKRLSPKLRATLSRNPSDIAKV